MRARDAELLLLTAFAALPLYFTGATSAVPLIAFHAALAVMVWRVMRGRPPAFVPEGVMRAVAIAYVPFYIVDAAVISRSAIAASTHLVLFIAVYQPMETSGGDNRPQRLLTAALLFVASIATSTDITIVLFVIGFTFVMFRQMMDLSHAETERAVGRTYVDAPSSRAAVFYLAGTALVGAFLFPLLPRLRNPLVRGVAGALSNATTGLSNTIDFNRERSSIPDPSVVARVWMGQDAIPFFTPLRLRGLVYDRFRNNAWLPTRRGFRPLDMVGGTFQLGRPIGFTRSARVQQRISQRNPRIYVPIGTYALSGLQSLAEGPTRGTYVTTLGRDIVTYDVSMARRVAPLRPEHPPVIAYPVTPPVAALARSMVGSETDPGAQAALVEAYMLRHFQYLAHPEQIGHTMTTDQFLLKERRGHCEYFAAGMVALMSALNVPARIVGGYYGGRLNPLTGYFVVRNEDAHAWVEVWEHGRWTTYDPTPPSMRPGNTQDGLLSTYATALSDSVNYFWDRYVLTYGLGDQIAFLAALISGIRDVAPHLRGIARSAFNRTTAMDLIGVVAAGIFIALVSAAVRRRRRSLFRLLADHLASMGIEVGPSMTMEEALAELRAQQPSMAQAIEPLIELYEAEQFSSTRDPQRVAAFRRKLSELRETQV